MYPPQRNFRERGRASEILELSELGYGLGVTQREMVPLQRQVLLEAVRHREEQKQKRMEEAQNGGGPTAGSVRNGANNGSTKSGTNRTVLSDKTYINENAVPDEE